MKLLNGRELADFIKERQAKQVRALRQAEKIVPKLAIIKSIDDEVINTYIRMKQQYGEDILIEVEVYSTTSEDLFTTIEKCNKDKEICGIIVQLPLANSEQTTSAVNLVAREKDVDGLREDALYTPATPMAIDWLLNGYNVNLKDKHIAIVGQGRLVGAPLAKLWRQAGYTIEVFDKESESTMDRLKHAEIIVTATGVPGLIVSDFVRSGAIVVDAATASEDGKIIGDVADEVRQREDITITPEKGGVGPMTIAALFDNVIRAARTQAEAKKSVRYREFL